MNPQDKYEKFKRFYSILIANINEYIFTDKDNIKNN